MKKTLIHTAFFLSVLYTPCLLSESASDYGDPNSIKRDEGSAPSNGGEGSADRAYKANNANNQGKTGTAEATVASSMLAAKSAAAYAALNFGLGAALAAMSALESAQAGATAATSTKNAGQRDMLLKNEQVGANESRLGSGTGNGNNSSPGSNISLAPSVESILRKQGIDIDQFKEKLASGALTGVDDVLDAMGVASRVTEFDRKQADRIASKTIRDSYEQTQANEGEKSTVSSNESAFGSVENSPSLSMSSESQKAASAGLKNYEIIEMASPGSINNKSKENGPNAGRASNGAFAAASMSEFLSKFSAENKQGMLERKLTDYEIQLEKSNVFPSTGRAQIFQIAHRNYREYGKWRKNMKLAIR